MGARGGEAGGPGGGEWVQRGWASGALGGAVAHGPGGGSGPRRGLRGGIAGTEGRGWRAYVARAGSGAHVHGRAENAE